MSWNLPQVGPSGAPTLRTGRGDSLGGTTGVDRGPRPSHGGGQAEKGWAGAQDRLNKGGSRENEMDGRSEVENKDKLNTDRKEEEGKLYLSVKDDEKGEKENDPNSADNKYL